MGCTCERYLGAVPLEVPLRGTAPRSTHEGMATVSTKKPAKIPHLTINGEAVGTWLPWKKGVRYDVWLPSEPRRRFSFYGRDHAAVVIKAQAAYDKIVAGTAPLSEQDLAALCTAWLKVNVPKLDDKGKYIGWKPATYKTNDSYVRNHIVFGVGTAKLDQRAPGKLCVALLDNYLRDLAGTMAESTRDHIRSVLCQICEWGVGTEAIPMNYAKYTKPITVPTFEPIVLKPPAAHRLIDACWNHPLGGVIILGVLTGAREGEILGVLESKIQSDEDGIKWLHIDTTLTRVGAKLAEMIGIPSGLQNSPTNKTNHPHDVPVVGAVEQVLEIARALKDEARRSCPSWKWQETDYIFTTSIGTPVDKKNFMTRAWYPLLAAAGLPKMRFHDLRHSQATLLHELGYDLTDSGAMLGQTQVKTTRGYTHISRDKILEMARHRDRTLMSA
jgi:integrase